MQLFQNGIFAGGGKTRFQICFGQKMIAHSLFAAAGDDEYITYTGTGGFFHHILDHRFVHQWDHFFGNSPGKRQKTGTEPGGGNDRFPDTGKGC